MDKEDWFIIEEAMCYASQHETGFKEFLKRNSNSKKLIKRFDRDKTDTGHKLVGILFKILNYPELR